MKREIKIKQQYLQEQNLLYHSAMIEVPESQWEWTALKPVKVFRSRYYLAQIFPELNGAIRISINRTMIDCNGAWLEGMTWDDLQGVKSDCGFADSWAVEIYPPDSDVVNVAAMRHLWVLPVAPTFAWRPAVSA